MHVFNHCCIVSPVKKLNNMRILNVLGKVSANIAIPAAAFESNPMQIPLESGDVRFFPVHARN